MSGKTDEPRWVTPSTFNQGVGGSIPPRLTTYFIGIYRDAIWSWSQPCYHFATTCIVQPIDGGLIAHRKPLSIGVHGQLDAGVAKLSLDVDRTLALLEQQRRERVAEGVRREMRRQSGALEQPYEHTTDVALVEWRAVSQSGEIQTQKTNPNRCLGRL